MTVELLFYRVDLHEFMILLKNIKKKQRDRNRLNTLNRSQI